MPNITQWRNIAELTSFPFMEGMDQSLNGLFIDARINLPPGSAGAYLSEISLDGISLRVSVFSVEGTSIGSGSASIEGDGLIELLNRDGVHVGIILFAKDATFISKEFTRTNALFETACLVSSPFRRVSSVNFNKINIPGKIALAEGAGIRIVKLNEQKIRIDAVGSTEGLEQCCPEIQNPVLKINDAVPDSSGNISLEPMPFEEPSHASDLMQILRISTGTNSLNFYLAK